MARNVWDRVEWNGNKINCHKVVIITLHIFPSVEGNKAITTEMNTDIKMPLL